jgi:hypothetical protein
VVIAKPASPSGPGSAILIASDRTGVSTDIFPSFVDVQIGT